MSYKFEQLDIWKLSLDYIETIYLLADKLPKSEEDNLKLQIVRAATSISLNIAESTIDQPSEEQAKFLDMATRSLIETVACQHIIQRRGYIQDKTLLEKIYEDSQALAKRLKVFRRMALPYEIREDAPAYGEDELI